MKPTGERYVHNEIIDQNAAEHIHRYQLASRFSGNKRILDIGCGSGYGSQLLKNCLSYTGIDISAEAIQHCKDSFGGPNIAFQVSDATKLEIPQERFDLITCFEVLEHVVHPGLIVQHAARLLKEDGLFISSTPDKTIYNSHRSEPNEFHVHEMEKHEYKEMLNANFNHTVLFAQNFVQCSFIYDPSSATNSWTEIGTEGFLKPETDPLPIYWIAISSNVRIPKFDLNSLFRSSFSRNLGGELVYMVEAYKKLELEFDQKNKP